MKINLYKVFVIGITLTKLGAAYDAGSDRLDLLESVHMNAIVTPAMIADLKLLETGLLDFCAKKGLDLNKLFVQIGIDEIEQSSFMIKAMEDQINFGLMTVLLSIKDVLVDKSAQSMMVSLNWLRESIIGNGKNNRERIELLLASMLFSGGIEKSALADNGRPTASEESFKFSQYLLIILDLYYRDQLFKIIQVFLKSIPKDKQVAYWSTLGYLRLKRHSLVHPEDPVDDITRWYLKGKLYYIACQTLGSIDQDFKNSFMPDDRFLEENKRIIPLVDVDFRCENFALSQMFAQQLLFLENLLEGRFLSISSLEDLVAIVGRYSDYAAQSHGDYGSLVQSLPLHEAEKNDLKTQCLIDFSQFIKWSCCQYFEHFSQLVKVQFSGVTAIEGVSGFVENIALPAQRLHIKLYLFMQTESERQDLCLVYQNGIRSACLMLLENIERIYSERSIVSKASAAWGTRSIKTKLFLSKLKVDIQKEFSFLSPLANEPQDFSILKQIADLESKMTEIDKAPMATISGALTGAWGYAGSWFGSAPAGKT